MKASVLFPDPYPDTDPDFRKDIYELQQFLIDELPLSFEVEIIKHPSLRTCIKVTNDHGQERFVKPSKNSKLLCHPSHQDAHWSQFSKYGIIRLILNKHLDGKGA